MYSRVFAFAGLLLVLSAGADAQTVTRPPPPEITMGANMKEFVFDWEPVPGAGTYRLYSNTGARGYFEPVSDQRIPASRSRAAQAVAVHKQLWSTTRYLVTACNSAGCTRSNEVAPTNDQMLQSIGYFKASNTGANDGLGKQVAMSVDGSTMAVSADGEDGTNNSLSNSGAVYVYRRNGRQWTQEALLKASDGLTNTRLGGGSPLAFRYMGLSANGSLLAVGAPTRSRSGQANAGVVLVFLRAADNSWSQVAQFSASTATANDYFGYSVDVGEAGTSIKVSSMYPQGGAGTPEGRTYVWNFYGGTWNTLGPIAPHFAGDRCPTVRMTTNAQLLVSACRTPTGEGRLVTAQRNGDYTWTHAAAQAYGWFENPNMAMTYSGRWLALHTSVTSGVTFEEGAISLFRQNGFNWVNDANWLSSSGGTGYNAFGHAIDFSRDGEYIAFSDPNWHASGAGAMESWTHSATADGAVLILKRRPDARPQHWYTRVLKSSNPGDLDRFGESVAFGGPTGHYLAIGAPGEDGAATGVDGDQENEAAANSGAVYLN
jgi:trimeric autotransporter adhesin